MLLRSASSTTTASSSSSWVPPFLPKPLGVEHRPSSKELSVKEKSERAMDPDRIKRERKAILSEVKKGYFQDWYKIREHGGKLWVAPSTVIRADRARYFPDIRGWALTKEWRHTTDLFRGKVSVVAMMGTIISEAHCKSYIDPTLDEYVKNPNFQFVQINLQENPVKGVLLRMFGASQARKMSERYHSTYLLSSQSIELEREDLGMMNKMIGYVFLVDSQARIRWAAVGFADESETKSEIASLRSCTGVLLKRLADGIEQ